MESVFYANVVMAKCMILSACFMVIFVRMLNSAHVSNDDCYHKYYTIFRLFYLVHHKNHDCIVIALEEDTNVIA